MFSVCWNTHKIGYTWHAWIILIKFCKFFLKGDQYGKYFTKYNDKHVLTVSSDVSNSTTVGFHTQRYIYVRSKSLEIGWKIGETPLRKYVFGISNKLFHSFKFRQRTTPKANVLVKCLRSSSYEIAWFGRTVPTIRRKRLFPSSWQHHALPHILNMRAVGFLHSPWTYLRPCSASQPKRAYS